MGYVSDESVIGLTLLEDVSPATGGIARVMPLAGAAPVGRGVSGLASRALGTGAGEPAVVYSAAGYFEEGTAAFKSQQGDGFTLRRDNEGRGARLTVCALSGGRPGRILARERLGEDDALVVRVPFGGRTRVLVVTAATISKEESARRQGAALHELSTGPGVAQKPVEPPFELQIFDR